MKNKAVITRDDYIKKEIKEVYNVNLAKVKEKYDSGQELDDLDRSLLILILDNEEDLRKVANGNEMLERVVDKIIEVNNDEEIVREYTEEQKRIKKNMAIKLLKEKVQEVLKEIDMTEEEMKKIIDEN